MRLLAHTAIFGALLLSFGCRGPSGLPGNKQIGELSDDEQKEACENVADYYDKKIGEEKLKDFACVTAGVFAAALSGGDVAICEAAYMDCLAAPDDGTMDDTTCEVSNDAPSCTATVAEYDDCLEEQVDALKDFLDGYSCATAASSMLPETGPACMALAQKCPELFSDNGEGT
ncbi:MAG: hypothetical protein H6710_18760 [Myxococcales bacterium]|nr:hypothetical protein [Myxococcales bacterium]MCB9706095.1 hypothetical protein [Myxococcales bacterium]